MISLEAIRKLEPTLNDLTDEELESVREQFYEFAQVMFEDWKEEKFDSKFPVRSLTDDR